MSTVIGLFRTKSANPKKDLEALLGDYELPSFQATVLATLRLLRDEDATGSQIAAQIELDPGLQMRVLRTVNAAAFGLSTKVSSVPHAVALLGRSRLEPIVLALAVKDTLPSAKTPGFDTDVFWHGSAVRAVAARGLARRLHAGTQDESFAAGLLLDMAVPILASLKGRRYTEAYTASLNGSGRAFPDLEKDALGYDHTAAGQLIAEAWELPDYLCSAIAGHHDFDAQDVEPAIKLSALVRDGDGLDDVGPMVETAMKRYGLSEEHVIEVLEHAFTEAGHFASLLA